jgi:hypothetical protein
LFLNRVMLHPSCRISALCAGAIAALVAVDRATQAGINQITMSYGSYTADFNGDGRTDFFLSGHHDAGHLYRNDGGRFTEVHTGLFPAGDRHGCAWGDVQQDGLPDLYCAIPLGNSPQKANELWLQQPDTSFIDMGKQFGVADSLGRARYATFLNANGDAYPDLYVLNYRRPNEQNATPNRLFINLAGAQFRAAPEFGLDGHFGYRCGVTLDYNADGWQDLLVCGSSKLFRNDGGTRFVNASRAAGLSTLVSYSATVADLNRDGLPDLAFVGPRGVFVQLRKAGSAAFAPAVMVRSIAAGESIAAGNVDGDRDVDLYVARSTTDGSTNAPDLMLKNNGSGTSFSTATIPQATSGFGESAAPIDYDGNGRTDFIVLNGYSPDHEDRGPVQLITFVRQ